MPFTFRNKIRLTDDFVVTSEMPRDQAYVAEQGDDGHYVAVFTDQRGTVTFYGQGYETPELAADAGTRWRRHLMIALAREGIGADFGDGGNPWSPGTFTKAAAAGKGVALRDYRLNVYEEDSNVVLIQNREATTMDADYVAPQDNSRSLEAIVDGPLARVSCLRYTVDERLELALNLLHLSYFESNPETRNVTLVTAIEALIVQAKRSSDVVDQLDKLIKQVKADEIGRIARNTILNALGNMKNQSINEAGQDLAEKFLTEDYDSLPPKDFFKRSYVDRCNLVHGSIKRPGSKTLRSRNPILTKFVTDLLDAVIFAN
ncbi:HEPN domain-containing protein [Mycolicibacterium fluoranthenivorans]|uniref:HEPN domain-containing protein n=1 Tax=Mycolicibacterium fluoranthenivorans TaxID=258505 RepID=UPI0011141A4D|nr:HEPN domain-containing protein [Mycolicibacterium fluoranthenivorans]